MNLIYTVTATLPNPTVREEYIAWLVGGHIQAVIAGGALDARVIAIDDPEMPLRVQCCYTFANRGAFDAYVRDHAPALRADGQRLFPPRTGITFERQVGSVVGEAGNSRGAGSAAVRS